MPYPHVTQFETIARRAHVAVEAAAHEPSAARPSRAWARRLRNRVARRRLLPGCAPDTI